MLNHTKYGLMTTLLPSLCFICWAAHGCRDSTRSEPRSLDAAKVATHEYKFIDIDFAKAIPESHLIDAASLGLSIDADVSQTPRPSLRIHASLRNNMGQDIMHQARYSIPLFVVIARQPDGRWLDTAFDSNEPCGTGVRFDRLLPGASIEAELSVPATSDCVRIGILVDPRESEFNNWIKNEGEEPIRKPDHSDRTKYGYVWGQAVTAR